MSSAAPPADAAAAPKSKKKLIIILAVVLVLVLAGGGAFFFMQQQKAKAAAAEEEGEEGAAPPPKVVIHKEEKKKDPKALPVFVALEPFTVNLADRDGSRYAQISVTLEIDDAKTGDVLKAYMPAVRNNVLLPLASKTAAQLLDGQGKLDLAREIQAEVLKPLGIEMEEPEVDDPKPGKKKRKPRPPPSYPVTAVHFANFLVQ